MPAGDTKFNVVGFSSNITKTINTATNRLIPSKTIASAGVTIDLNKKVGATIANPPLAPINANIKNLANQTKELVKNPGGVAKNAANAAFGKLTVQVNASLGQLRNTLVRGITNCLRNAISSLLRRIPFPNIPFGTVIS